MDAITFSDVVKSAAMSRVFPARKERLVGLQGLIDWIASDKPIDRIVLADLLAGQLNRPGGRPRLTADAKARRRDLIRAARAKRDEFRKSGMDAGNATAAAALWASTDPRNEEDRTASTIEREMQHAKDA